MGFDPGFFGTLEQRIGATKVFSFTYLEQCCLIQLVTERQQTVRDP